MRPSRTFATSCFGGAATVLVLGAMSLAIAPCSAQDLAAPVRLIADGQVIDTGPAWGHSSPCMEDIDGDGLKDLILGDFSGKFRIYKNVGTATDPQFKDAGLLQAGNVPAEVRIYCCIGSQPRFVDLDGDGQRDMLSNSYDPGHCYLFRGLGGGKFAERQELVDRAGVPVRSAPQQQQVYQSFGSFVTPVDWDADGDADLLIGCFDGHLKLRMNEGDAQTFVFAEENLIVEAGGEPLAVGKHCCPAVADWDGDGLWDLIVGADDGSVTWFRNTGAPGKPQFDAGITLVDKHEGNGYDKLIWSEDDIRPGIRAQVEVVDFNGDGKLDLLLGDFKTAYAPRTDLTDEQKEEIQTLVAEQDALVQPFVESMEQLRKDFARRYPGDAIYGDEAEKAWREEYQALRESPIAKRMEESEAQFVQRMRPLLATTRGEGDSSFDLANSYGYVWLYLRK